MADESVSTSTIFKGVINNPKGKNKILVTAKLEKQPKTPIAEKKTVKPKEDAVPKAKTIAETTRNSTKNDRAPLKVLNAPAKTVKKTVAPKKTENNVGTKRKSSGKTDPIPAEAKLSKKVNQSVPKIIIHKDVPGRSRGASKSLDCSKTPGGKSVVNVKKNPKSSVENKTVRHSTGDLPNAKSPGKPKLRLSKFKPGEPEFDEMTLKLENLFPNIDPEFIKSVFVKHKGSLPETIEFLIKKEKEKEVPTKFDYVRRQMAEKVQNEFLDNFSVKNFVEMIPEPWEYFLKQKHRHNNDNYIAHSLHYLKNKYKNHYIKTIQTALMKNECSLYLANKYLKKRNPSVKTRIKLRSKYECDLGKPSTFDIHFLQEVAFLENESKIKSYLKKAEAAKTQKVKESEKAGTLLDCQSCCGSGLLSDDVVNCPSGHVFCKDCIIKYVKIETGKDNFQFNCLTKCKETISLKSLQAILSPTELASIVQRNRQDEVKSEQFEELIYCPFCFHIVLISPKTNLLKCPNPKCRLDTCRKCKQLNHFPLQCQDVQKFDKSVLEVIREIEKQKDEEIKKEEIEGDLCLKCEHCNEDFLKLVDSDRMVCPCGASICCVCRQPECHHVDSELSKHRLSTCSECTNFSNHGGNPTEDDPEGSSCSSNESQGFSHFESDTF